MNKPFVQLKEHLCEIFVVVQNLLQGFCRVVFSSGDHFVNSETI